MMTETLKPAETPAEFLRMAADHIERVGLNQDGLYFKYPPGVKPTTEPMETLRDLSCCTVGAFIATPRASLSIRLTAEDAMREYLGSTWITRWSDNSDQQTVCATLREVADKLEQKK